MYPYGRRIFAIFLAVFVLLAQQGASLHALSHATQDVAAASKISAGKQAPDSHDLCEQCLAFAAASAALVGSMSFPLQSFAHATGTTPTFVQIQPRTTIAYHSRAPPQHLV